MKSAAAAAVSGAAGSNGTKRESFMQYTKASSSIYNHDKHVFPIRTPLLLHRRESSDRDHFSSGIASSEVVPARVAAGYRQWSIRALGRDD